jgi:hypothetical protein
MIARSASASFILGLLLLVVQAASPTDPTGPGAIPAAVATFVRAYAAGDEATILAAASPLYRLELNRRGITTPAERSDVRPRGVTFTARGGARDAEGFGHWIYTTRSSQPARKAPLTLWRIDSDLHDFVIWIEPVYFFSGCDDVASDDGRATSQGRSNEESAASSMVLLALHCPETAEGYYAIRSGDGRQLSFSVVNGFGDTLPGAWSFGQSDEQGDRSVASILSVNATFKGPGDQEYVSYYHVVRR